MVLHSPLAPRVRRCFSWAVLALVLLTAAPAHAQLPMSRTGAHRSDVAWHEFTTVHFRVIYHDGLESHARQAANVAEVVYPVVTGNLGTPLPGRTPLFLSDLDEVPNAFAMSDRYVFVWMRGILDDTPPVGIRSSGRAKWFRAVITHELTHIVIEHATRTLLSPIAPLPGVPRWFHEGVSRAMEPDPWTNDVDMALRVAAVNAQLDYRRGIGGVLDGTLLYETGHALVRYMIWRFGDSVIARILDEGHGPFGYNFERAVASATGTPLSEIVADWTRASTLLYATEYAWREEASELGPLAIRGFDVVFGVRFTADRRRAAVLASAAPGRPARLHIVEAPLDSSQTSSRVLVDEPGADAEFSFDPTGERLVVSRSRRSFVGSLIRDLYIVDVATGSSRRLTDEAMLHDPAWSPDGRRIVAVEKRSGRDIMTLVDLESGARSALTIGGEDVQFYTPAWSPDGAYIAASQFDPGGLRSVVVVDAASGMVSSLTSDTSNTRYPVWSPDGRRIAFVSDSGGVANLYVMNRDGSGRRRLTSAATGAFAEQWLPGTDTIVALTFESRDRIRPRLVDVGRTAPTTTGTPSPVPERYSAWRNAGFPLRVPVAIPDVALLDSGRYSIIGGLYPLVPILPTVNAGRSPDGSSHQPRFGVTSIWTEPLGVHVVVAAVDFGGTLGSTGGEILYVNSRLPVSLWLHADYSLGLERFIGGRHYHQRNRALSLAGVLELPERNGLAVPHRFSAGLAVRSPQPWNLPELRNAGVSDSLLPVSARLVEATIGYAYSTASLAGEIHYLRSDRTLGSQRQYQRAELMVAAQGVPWAPLGLNLLGSLQAAATTGSPLPQDELGLEEGELLEGRWIDVTEWLAPRTAYRVRGFRAPMRGDRLIVANAGLVAISSPHIELFAETGTAWYASTTPLSMTSWRTSLGAELSTVIGGVARCSVGIARGLGSRDEGTDWYARVSM